MIINQFSKYRNFNSIPMQMVSFISGSTTSRVSNALSLHHSITTPSFMRISSASNNNPNINLTNTSQRFYSVYPIGDLAGSINMGLRSQQSHVYAYVQSKTCLSLLDCLYENGFIEYYHFTQGKTFRPVVQIGLKRFMGRDIFHGLQVWSRPGHKRIVSVAKLAHLKRKGLHFLVKTNRGVMTDDQALAYNMGGELLLRIMK